MPNGQDFERMKFELEKRKVELEEQKNIRESRFFNKHFGVIITSIISAATIIVSVTQLLISSSYNATQLKNEIEKTKRSFDFEVAKFLMEKGADIITTDVGKAQYIRAVVLSSFPTEVATRVSTSMRDISPAIEIRNVWSESVVYSQSLAPAQTKPSAFPTSSLSVDMIMAGFGKELTESSKKEVEALLLGASQFGIKERDDVNLFLSFVFHNSNFLRIKTESFKYNPQRMLTIWPQKFKSLEDATPFANNPEKLANFVYEGRMGNTDPGDGFKFRGRGYLQVTGRDAYRRVGAELGIDLEANPDAILEISVNAKSAAYLFSLQLAAAKTKGGKADLITVNRSLNVGIDGISGVNSIYERIRALRA